MKLLCVVTLTLLAAYYIYVPLPPGVAEPWKLMLVGAAFRTVTHVADLTHSLGVTHHIHVINVAISMFEWALPADHEEIRTLDTEFDGVSVRVYQPEARGGALRRGVVFIHGGGWSLGKPKLGSYDLLCRKMAAKLEAVVVTIDYRMAPVVRFPVQYDECVQASRHFLQREVLAYFRVDPGRVAVCGDSAGGNLAAAVAQRISQEAVDPARAGLKLQVLIYPVLQALDFNTASYQQNQHVPILYRPLMARYWLEYLGAEPGLVHALLLNNHSALDHARLEPHRAKLDWTALVPAEVRRHHGRVFPRTGSPGVLETTPALLDVRAAPLLAGRRALGAAPAAYVATGEHDVLRDDGVMYARRLRLAGVSVEHRHYHDGFHGCVSFAFWPLFFRVGIRIVDDYIAWMDQNL